MLSSQPEDVPSRAIASSEPTVQKAKQLIDAGDLSGARRILLDLLANQPNHHEARLHLGHIALKSGDRNTAIAQWQQIPDSNRKLAASARFLEGDARLKQHQAREAESLLKRSIKLNPHDPQPHQRLLALYVAQMRPEAIRTQLASLAAIRPLTLEESALEISASDRILNTELGIQTTRSFVDADEVDAESLIALAKYLSEQQPDKAISLLESKPQHLPLTSYLLAHLKLEAGDPDAARRSLAAPNRHDPSSAFDWYVLARLHEADANWPEAINAYSKSIQLDPFDGKTTYRLGRVLERVGQREDSLKQLARAKTLDSLKEEVYRLSRTNRDRPDALSPVLTNIADLLSDLTLSEASRRWYQLALKADPNNHLAQQRYSTLQNADPKLHAHDASFNVPPATPAQSPTALPTLTNAAPKDFSSESIIQFEDQHVAAGLDFTYFNGETGNKYLVETVGGGVAVLDYDGDGWPDLYFCQGSDLPHNPQNLSHSDRLFRNSRDGTFEDVTLQAGLAEHNYSLGCATADIDNDGDPDLYITNHGRDTLYLNNGDGTFTDATVAAGLLTEAMSASAGFADFDGDGNLDLFVATYVDALRLCRDSQGRISTCDPKNHDGPPDLLYRNNGDGTFEDISIDSGIAAPPDGKGLGLLITDLDGDHRPDIYVANDTTPNFLFFNRTDSGSPIRFEERGLPSGTALNGNGETEAGMGIACADFNGDGLQDLHVTNFYHESNTLYQNLGGGLFEDITRAAKLAAPTFPWLGFGTQAADFDLNGTPDLFVANGHIDNFESRGEPWKMPPQLFRNHGSAHFEEISDSAGPYFRQHALGRAVARLDWNRDGRPDLVVVNQDRPAALLTNTTSNSGNFLRIRLHGTTSNRDAIGTRLQITANGLTQSIVLTGGNGIMCTNEKTILVGLGQAQQITQLQVIWPSGEQTTFSALPANCTATLTEGRNNPRLSLTPNQET